MIFSISSTPRVEGGGRRPSSLRREGERMGKMVVKEMFGGGLLYLTEYFDNFLAASLCQQFGSHLRRKGNCTIVYLRYGGKDMSSPSTLILAAIKG